MFQFHNQVVSLWRRHRSSQGMLYMQYIYDMCICMYIYIYIQIELGWTIGKKTHELAIDVHRLELILIPIALPHVVQDHFRSAKIQPLFAMRRPHLQASFRMPHLRAMQIDECIHPGIRSHNAKLTCRAKWQSTDTPIYTTPHPICCLTLVWSYAATSGLAGCAATSQWLKLTCHMSLFLERMTLEIGDWT